MVGDEDEDTGEQEQLDDDEKGRRRGGADDEGAWWSGRGGGSAHRLDDDEGRQRGAPPGKTKRSGGDVEKWMERERGGVAAMWWSRRGGVAAVPGVARWGGYRQLRQSGVGFQTAGSFELTQVILAQVNFGPCFKKIPRRAQTLGHRLRPIRRYRWPNGPPGPALALALFGPALLGPALSGPLHQPGRA
jgi:hypothetical protein